MGSRKKSPEKPPQYLHSRKKSLHLHPPNKKPAFTGVLAKVHQKRFGDDGILHYLCTPFAPVFRAKFFWARTSSLNYWY